MKEVRLIISDFAALPSLFLMKGRLNAHEESVPAILLYYRLKLL